MIVPFPSGGSIDVVMRTFSNRLAELAGRNVIIASTPEAFGKHLRAELGKWAKVVKEAGLKAE